VHIVEKRECVLHRRPYLLPAPVVRRLLFDGGVVVHGLAHVGRQFL
jgi:hypothetical protein